MTAEEREVLLRQLKEHGVAVWRDGDLFVRMGPTETVVSWPKDPDDDKPVDPRLGLEEFYKDRDAGVG